MSRNLVVCCDGTNNEIAGDATNVLRLYRMLVRDSEQIAFYDCGVGTIANPDRISGVGRTFSRCFDSAMGLTIRQHFLNAYRFLVRHYEPGDKIFLTGFSRGAYTARAVAGAVHMHESDPIPAGSLKSSDLPPPGVFLAENSVSRQVSSPVIQSCRSIPWT